MDDKTCGTCDNCANCRIHGYNPRKLAMSISWWCELKSGHTSPDKNCSNWSSGNPWERAKKEWNMNHKVCNTPMRATTYRDGDANTYKVMSGIGERVYKARKNKPGSVSWKGVRQLEWRDTFEQAQADLDALAQVKGWYPMEAIN